MERSNNGSYKRFYRCGDKGANEGGWVGYQLGVLPENASDIQIAETRQAFFCGAQHLFSSIMSFLEEGVEPTANDLDRMSKINDELQEFIRNLKQTLRERHQ